MKNNNEFTMPVELGKKNLSFYKVMIFYISVMLAALVALSFFFNALIEKHDRQLTSQICDLVAEKMNNSIRYMTDSARNMAVAVSSREISDMQVAYEELKNNMQDTEYLSIGLIDNSGNIYASESEKNEFEKWSLVSTAEKADPVSISVPYRSGKTGKLVFTMFANLVQNDKKVGSLFMTYPLEEIENMANTKSVTEETEIWLMDGSSDNIIRCSGSENYLLGSWSNTKLTKGLIASGDRKEYENWSKKMRSGENVGTAVFKLDGVEYTQVFEKTNFMQGWNIVVRIPNSSLSDSIQVFRKTILIFMSVMLIATVVLFSYSHNRVATEKRILENLSVQDPLTDVLNRRAFELLANDYLTKQNRSSGVLIFFDIDYFKQVNDLYGHDSGDYILKEFASVLKNTFTQNSCISRFGGDEFVVLLKNFSSREDVDSLLDKMREQLSTIKIEEDEKFSLHFSAGIAEIPKNGKNLDDLQKAADDALYIVKQRGRNSSEWASE